MSSVALAVLESWRFEPALALLTALVAAVYLRGWSTLRSQMPERFPPWRLAAFLAGLICLYVALASPLDTFAALLLQVHMVQHLLLMAIAPPLLLLGAPAIPLLRGLPAGVAREVAGPFLAAAEVRRVGDFLSHPVVCWLAMSAATWFWHAPGPYQLALASPFWHEVEHLSFLVGGLLFWWPVVQPWPSRARWPEWTLPPYLLLADLQNTALAAILVFSGRAIYPVYDAVPRLGSLSALDDQVTAGVLMWVPMSLLYLVPASLITIRLLSPSWSAGGPPAGQRRALPLSAIQQTDRATLARLDVLRLPYLGPLLRHAATRRVAQTTLLLLAALTVADGLFGPQMSPMNLAGVLPWTYWRAFVVVGLLVAGNLFCAVCPFTLPRALARRLGLRQTLEWPRRLRGKWLALALLATFFWAYEVFDLWDAPRATAILILAYFAGAFAVDAVFRGASFCKFVCPIGQFQFVESLVSPLEVSVREASACAGCTTHDCLRGNERERGCEMELFLPRKAGNLDCTFCLDCVRACPRDNVGVFAVTPGRELARDPDRSAIGRLSQRLDLALLALLLVFGSVVTAAAMVGPVATWVRGAAIVLGASEGWTMTLLLGVGGLVLPLLALSATAACTRWWSGGDSSLREVFCRFSFALLPLGLAMWTSHFVFHLAVGWSSIVPVLQRVATEVGIGSGAPDWTMPAPLLGGASLLRVEILLLDVGLLLALHAGWRIATANRRRAIAALLPWALVAVAVWAGGVWVFLQPMEMRGMVH